MTNSDGGFQFDFQHPEEPSKPVVPPVPPAPATQATQPAQPTQPVWPAAQPTQAFQPVQPTQATQAFSQHSRHKQRSHSNLRNRPSRRRLYLHMTRLRQLKHSSRFSLDSPQPRHTVPAPLLGRPSPCRQPQPRRCLLKICRRLRYFSRPKYRLRLPHSRRHYRPPFHHSISSLMKKSPRNTSLVIKAAARKTRAKPSALSSPWLWSWR